MLQSDTDYLKQALTLAEQYRGFTAPNPAVGCVIVRNNQVIATGQHKAAGQPHAEVEALANLNTNTNSNVDFPTNAISSADQRAGANLNANTNITSNTASHLSPNVKTSVGMTPNINTNSNANETTLYVTLEPCCHFGRTPPCTDAIIKANIKRVVFAYRDPNPLVAGQGQAALQSAGIQCDHVPLAEIDTFYQSYAFWRQHKKPFVTAKIAMTLDGKIADANSQPITLTGKEAQQLTHYWRKKSDCILTTAKTIIQDDPQLNVRLQNEIIAKPLYILDRNLTLPLHAKIYHTAKSITLFHKEGLKIPSHLASYRCIPIKENAEALDLQQVISHIGSDGMHDLWIEAGGQCFSNCLRDNLLQRAFIYIAPMIMGSGLPAFSKIVNWSENQVKWRILGKDAICEIEWLREVE